MSKKYYQFPCGCAWPIVGDPPRDGALPFMEVDDSDLPFCSATWELLAKGLTKGVFQLESSLGRTWTKKLRPESAEHLGALGALLRPGCLRAKDAQGISMTEHYVLRKNGEEEVASYQPDVDGVLASTYNVLAYQEQAMKLAQVVAGFNLQDADVLRKAIGKKLPEEMAKCRRMFLEGAAKAGILTTEQAEEVFGWIEASQRYSFNRSHAISYGLLGYDTAYIKAHFPVAFFANWLCYAKDKSDPRLEIAELVEDAKLFDITVEPPDLQDLAPNFVTDGVTVRFGLTDVKGVGGAQVEKLKQAVYEAQHVLGRPLGEWSWEDFVFHVAHRVSTATLLTLASVGTFRWAAKSRKRLANELQAWENLTVKEQAFGRLLYDFGRGTATLEQVVGRPRPERPPVEDVAWLAANTPDWETMTPRRRAGVAKKLLTAWQKKDGAWAAETKAVEGNLKTVAGVIRAVGEFGASNVKREGAVRGEAEMLDHPPSAEVDNPNSIVWAEEQALGVPLSCSRVDDCDISAANCTCKEFRAGRTGFLVLAVEIRACREIKTKRGKNPGQKMAFMTVADSSCALEDVTVFSEAYKKYGSLFKEKATVLIEGERDPKRDSFIVNHAWTLE